MRVRKEIIVAVPRLSIFRSHHGRYCESVSDSGIHLIVACYYCERYLGIMEIANSHVSVKYVAFLLRSDSLP